MKVKKYIAPTMPEVMKQIRNELGSDAVILNSKEIKRGGFLGLFKKTKIEVVAALDPQPVPAKNSKPAEEMRKQTIPNESLSSNTLANQEVLNEIKHLKKMIHHSSQGKNNYPADYQIVYQYLIDQEVVESVADNVINTILQLHKDNDVEPTYDIIKRDVRVEIENKLSQQSFQGITYERKVVHFVGPTGVGKTTTLAKIAANSMLKEHKNVAFITTDTYRIAAIEQLKTYAQILDVPIEVAYTIEDYINAVKKFKSYDLILVDTAGRNFRNEKYVKELKNSMDSSLDMDTYLVLSLTAKPKDLTEIFDQFHHLPIKEVIFTKVDETRQYGSMLNIALEKQIGIAYLTNGQDVPDDLLQVTPELVTNYVMGGNSDA